MTVAELIEKLKTMPQNAECWVDLVNSEGLAEVDRLHEVEASEISNIIFLSGPDPEAGKWQLVHPRSKESRVVANLADARNVKYLLTIADTPEYRSLTRGQEIVAAVGGENKTLFVLNITIVLAETKSYIELLAQERWPVPGTGDSSATGSSDAQE